MEMRGALRKIKLLSKTCLVGSFEVLIAGSTIMNSYSQAAILNTYSGGSPSGVIGGLFGSGIGSLSIQKSYATGSLTTIQTNRKGCIAGDASSLTLTLSDVYFDSTRCLENAVNMAGYAGATNLSTGSFQTATPFTNWSSLIWSFVSGQDPKLLWEP